MMLLWLPRTVAWAAAPLLYCHALLAQVDTSRYHRGTIQAIIDREGPAIAEAARPGVPNWNITGNSFSTRTIAIFTGEHRPLNPLRREVLRRWAVGILHDSSIAGQYDNEYLFRESGRDHWLAVQRALEPDIAHELKPGDSVTLFVAWFGAHTSGGPITWLFSVNDFDSGK